MIISSHKKHRESIDYLFAHKLAGLRHTDTTIYLVECEDELGVVNTIQIISAFRCSGERFIGRFTGVMLGISYWSCYAGTVRKQRGVAGMVEFKSAIFTAGLPCPLWNLPLADQWRPLAAGHDSDRR